MSDNNVIEILNKCIDADNTFQEEYDDFLENLYEELLEPFGDIIKPYEVNKKIWDDFFKKNSSLYENKCNEYLDNFEENEEENSEEMDTFTENEEIGDEFGNRRIFFSQ